MSLALLQGYSSNDEDGGEEAARELGQNKDSDGDRNNASSLQRYRPLFDTNSTASFSLSSAFDAFPEISGTPQFLNNCVEEGRKDVEVQKGRHGGRWDREDKKDLPAGTLVEAKAQLVGIHGTVRSDGVGNILRPSSGGPSQVMNQLTLHEPPPGKELLYVFLTAMRLPCFYIRLPLLFSSPLPEDENLRQLFLQNDLHQCTSSRRDLTFIDKHLKDSKSDNASLVVITRNYLSRVKLIESSLPTSALPSRHSCDSNRAVPVRFATWWNWIYVLGAFQSVDVSNSIKNHRFAIGPPLELQERTPMHSGKGIFISVEHKNIIYVLAGSFYNHNRPKHVFEAYSCEEDFWEVLDNPPFLILNNYYAQYACMSYVVIDDKIHVSTSCGAFSYDIGAKKWGPCHLFEGFDSHQGFDCHQELSTWESKTCRLCGQLNCRRHETVEAGPPFEFQGKALLYENNILLCMTPEEEVLAYRIECGRVVEKQELIYLPMQYSDHSFYVPLGIEIDYGPLVSLGDGYFCLTCKRIIVGASKFVVLIFKVSRLATAGKDCFLSSRIISLKVIDGYEADDRWCFHTALAV